MSKEKIRFGASLRAIREGKGWKQEDLAMMLKCTEGTISFWERGLHAPRFDDLFKLAQALSCSVDLLLFGKRK